MGYLVMECRVGYAVVLDSEGRFLKVPNLGYEVGQVLDSIIELDEDISSNSNSVQNSAPKQQIRKKHFARWAAMAACLCVMLLGGWEFWQLPIGMVRMQINPDVQMSVNHFDRVVGLEGLNEDGETLIEDYHSYGKAVETVSDELADRAMEKGFLREGGQITLTVESERERWRTATEEILLLELELHLEHRITVIINPESHSETSESPPGTSDSPPETIIIEPDKILPEQRNTNGGREAHEDTVPNINRYEDDAENDDGENDDGDEDDIVNDDIDEDDVVNDDIDEDDVVNNDIDEDDGVDDDIDDDGGVDDDENDDDGDDSE